MEVGLILWTSKKQPCVALSTTESEYIAEVLAVQEAIWLSQLLSEIGIDSFLVKPTPIYADNNEQLRLLQTLSSMQIRNIAIRFHGLRGLGEVHEDPYCRNGGRWTDDATRKSHVQALDLTDRPFRL